MKLTDIKKLEDVYKVNGTKKEPTFKDVDESERKYTLAAWRWRQIVKALNTIASPDKEWKPDWSNSNEWKYNPYAWFKKNKSHPSGFGFSFAHYVFTRTGTYVGSRLVFNTYDAQAYAVKKFKKVYEAYMLY